MAVSKTNEAAAGARDDHIFLLCTILTQLEGATCVSLLLHLFTCSFTLLSHLQTHARSQLQTPKLTRPSPPENNLTLIDKRSLSLWWAINDSTDCQALMSSYSGRHCTIPSACQAAACYLKVNGARRRGPLYVGHKRRRRRRRRRRESVKEEIRERERARASHTYRWSNTVPGKDWRSDNHRDKEGSRWIV